MMIRLFQYGDAEAVSRVICTTLSVSNKDDYSPEFIRENLESHSPEVMRQRAAESHFYVAEENGCIIGCGGITGYWGSTTESYLVSIFVLPEHQGQGIGRRIVETLEQDPYFHRAWRTEVGSSLTAVQFYRHLGYTYKNGITTPDEYGVVRLEKRNSGAACPENGEKIDNYTFRPAAEADKAAVFALYDSVKGTEYCTWTDYYPGDEEWDFDLQQGQLFVLLDGDKCIGAVSVVGENELDDLKDWTVRDHAREIARLAIAPAYQGKGLAAKLVERMEALLRKDGCGAVHLLAACKNTPACKTYEKLGYRFFNTYEMYGNTYFACEKKL